MYELCEIILNNHNIPIAHYKTYQNGCSISSFKSFLESSCSDPVFSLVVPPYPDWKSGHIQIGNLVISRLEIWFLRSSSGPYSDLLEKSAGVGRDN
jgi:hypothetical protein